MVISQKSSTNSQTFLDRAKTTALNRWKLETLTGLLGYKSLKHHQAESEKNQEAENAAARRAAWGESGVAKGDDMGDQIILGDNVHPTPIVMPSQGSGLGKVLIGAALAAGLMGIPAAGIIGYGLSKVLEKSPSNTTTNTTTGDNLDIGLGRIEDLLPASPGP